VFVGSRKFLTEFSLWDRLLEIVKAPHDGFGNGRKILRLADLKLSKSKAASAEVCAVLRLLLVKSLRRLGCDSVAERW